MKLFGRKIVSSGSKGAFAIVKLSGYIFYTIENGPGNILKFKRTWADCVAFVLSFSFSIAGFWFIGVDRFPEGMKSRVIVIGVGLLFKLLLISIAALKLITFINSRMAFKFIQNIDWIDRKVSLFNEIRIFAK